MADEMEMQARRLNEADSKLRSAVQTYRDEGLSEEDLVEKVEEIWAEDE